MIFKNNYTFIRKFWIGDECVDIRQVLIIAKKCWDTDTMYFNAI